MENQYTFGRALLWLTIYLLLALLPLGIALVGDLPDFRTFWIEFGVATGFIGLAILGLQFLFSGRFRRIAPNYGMDNIINYHREMGMVAFVLILAHPVILILSEPGYIDFFDPTVNFFRAIALITATIALLLIMATSLWRVTFGLIYEHWRLLHDVLALALVFIGVVHSIQVGYYLDTLWKKVMIAVLLGSCMYLALHTRIVRPWLMQRHPYKIQEVVEEAGGSWTIALEPERPPSMTFRPGQFAWITIGSTPWSLQQHPFSFASSSRSARIRFTASEEGDFTSSWKHLEKGTYAWLEGPFGSFTTKADKHLFLIMGGIGITPAMSMLRTMADDGDPRKATLIYANVEESDITFRQELDKLQSEIDLQVIHLLENPPEEWEGEEGLVTLELLEKYLPDHPESYIYYICGPGPMMDIAEISLRTLNIPWNHIYTERFQIV